MVATEVFDANSNQDYPFDRLIEQLKLSGDRSRNPLFDTMFVFHQRGEQELTTNAGKLKFFGSRLRTNAAVVDLAINAYLEKDDTLVCSWQYNRDLFKRETIARMASHYQNITQAVLANPEQPIREIELLTPEERRIF